MILLKEKLWLMRSTTVFSTLGCSVTSLSKETLLALPLRRSAKTSAASHPSTPVTLVSVGGRSRVEVQTVRHHCQLPSATPPTVAAHLNASRQLGSQRHGAVDGNLVAAQAQRAQLLVMTKRFSQRQNTGVSELVGGQTVMSSRIEREKGKKE